MDTGRPRQSPLGITGDETEERLQPILQWSHLEATGTGAFEFVGHVEREGPERGRTRWVVFVVELEPFVAHSDHFNLAILGIASSFWTEAGVVTVCGYQQVVGIKQCLADSKDECAVANHLLQGLRRKVALFEHSGYEKSIRIEPAQEGVSVTFQAKESGSSDRKRLSGEQFVDLFTELFDRLQLSPEDRRKIFIEGDTKAVSASVAEHTGQEVASTKVGFSEKARYRLIIDEHGSDAGLLKLQEMREDGSSAEFPNTCHFMLTEWELLRVLSPEHGPGFTKPTIEALFVDVQPETVFYRGYQSSS